MIIRALVCSFALSFFAHNSAADLPDFAKIVDAASPAVVKILVEYESVRPSPEQQLEELPEPLRPIPM